MRYSATTSAVLTICLPLLPPADDAACQTARFWLSTSDSESAGPEEPAIGLAPGETRWLHIWARPLPGKQLRSFALNVTTKTPGVDFVDGSFTVHNNINELANRFEFVHDSSVPNPLQSSSDGIDGPDELDGFLGTTLHPMRGDENGLVTHDSIGIGPDCHPDDLNCFIARDGPTWRIASFQLQVVPVQPVPGGGGGVTGIYLQIGDQGMRHYAPLAGDYNQNGAVALDDYEGWRATYCAGNGCLGGLLADGNGDARVDAADYVVWRANVGMEGAGVEPSSLTNVNFGKDELFVYNAGPGDLDSSCVMTNLECTFIEDSPDATVIVVGPLGAGSVVAEPGSACLGLVALILVSLKHLIPACRSLRV
jgi:hypothetical protein